MKTIIENYRHLAGEHCGSIAMKNLINYYCNIDLNEEIIFGLGAGIDFIYLEAKNSNPAIMAFGRSIQMEMNCAQNLGIDYREDIELNNQKAWEEVKTEVSKGRPTMLTGDTFFLDYHFSKVRFPAHRFVIVGFDDSIKKAFIADRKYPTIQLCSYDCLEKSRNPKTGLSTFNLWGKFYDTAIKNTYENACLRSLKKSVGQMLCYDTSSAELIKSVSKENSLHIKIGIEGLKKFRESIINWNDRDDASFLANYVSDSIEKYGTGGGNFRKMYASFLGWGHSILPDIVDENIVSLAERSAANWTELSELLLSASENPESKDVWKHSATKLDEITELETALFEKLSLKTG